MTIQMPVYAEGSYDYDSCTSNMYSSDDFKKMIIDEVNFIRNSSPLYAPK